MEREPETWDQAILRLARIARWDGVGIWCHDVGRSPEYFASTFARPGILHRVTLVSCDCEQFVAYQRCLHHARLLDELGELPGAPETTGFQESEFYSVEVACPVCAGKGRLRADDRGRPRGEVCRTCQGTGRRTITVPEHELSLWD